MVLSIDPSCTNMVPMQLCTSLRESARGIRGLGHPFGDKLYFTWDIPEQKWIPKTLVTPKVPKPTPKPAPKRGKQPATKPTAASSSIYLADGEYVKFYIIAVQKKGR